MSKVQKDKTKTFSIWRSQWKCAARLRNKKKRTECNSIDLKHKRKVNCIYSVLAFVVENMFATIRYVLSVCGCCCYARRLSPGPQCRVECEMRETREREQIVFAIFFVRSLKLHLLEIVIGKCCYCETPKRSGERRKYIKRNDETKTILQNVQRQSRWVHSVRSLFFSALRSPSFRLVRSLKTVINLLLLLLSSSPRRRRYHRHRRRFYG